MRSAALAAAAAASPPSAAAPMGAACQPTPMDSSSEDSESDSSTSSSSSSSSSTTDEHNQVHKRHSCSSRSSLSDYSCYIENSYLHNYINEERDIEKEAEENDEQVNVRPHTAIVESLSVDYDRRELLENHMDDDDDGDDEYEEIKDKFNSSIKEQKEAVKISPIVNSTVESNADIENVANNRDNNDAVEYLQN